MQIFKKMSKLITYSPLEIEQQIISRVGERKLGELMQLIRSADTCVQELSQQKSHFVLLGIPEDIGVRANLGRAGTATAWESVLYTLLNLQHNSYCQGEWITILGTLDFSLEMEKTSQLNPQKEKDRNQMFEFVSQIDQVVTFYVSKIVESGKTPIIVGGGHNNAYGNIKGFSLAKKQGVNVINFDAHTDLRPMKGRHSGNGFSYAMGEGYLENYFIFGLHENYLTECILNEVCIHQGRVLFNTYEQIKVREEKHFVKEMQRAQQHIGKKPFGIEIDLDSIPMVASSAMTPSGFSAEHVRQFIHYFGSLENAGYLHLCEAAPILSSDKNPNLTGKFISYLITDFIKAKMNQK